MEFVDSGDGFPPRYERLIGAKTGLVRSLVYDLPKRSQPGSRVTTPFVTKLWGPDWDVEAVGKGEDLQTSMVTAVGEAVERYCSNVPLSEDELRQATYRDLAREEPVVDFEYLDVYDQSEEAYTSLFAPVSEETDVYWTTGVDLLTGSDVYLPAVMIRPFPRSLAGSEYRFFRSSNGTAAGPTRTASLVSAILEVVERDAFMRTWCSGESPPAVPVSRFPEVEACCERLLQTNDLDVHFFELDSPLDVATFGGALVDANDTAPKFVASASAGLDPRKTLRDIVVELGHVWPYAERKVREDAHEFGAPVDDFEENLKWYAAPEHFGKVRFLLDGDETDTVESPPDVDDALRYLLCELDEAGCTPVAYDLTTRDAASVGIDVTRVVVPELVDFTPPSLLPKEHPELEGVDVYDYPHPFP